MAKKKIVNMGDREIKRRFLGKIGFCDNSVLGIKGENGKFIKGGHYVYIREVNGEKCDINVITSLENKNEFFQIEKLKKVKRGLLYPVPKDDANFTQWSAVNLDGNINNIPLSKISKIGYRSMKKRHRFFVGKYTNKK